MADINKQKVGAAFGRAADDYDAIANFQRRVSRQLADQLPAISAEYILDGGCGTGASRELLTRCWPDAMIVGCDLSLQMLKKAHSRKLVPVCGDLEQLPFSDASFHLAWSSLALQWCQPHIALPELQRVLKPGGKLLFSTLVNGSLQELNSSFGDIDTHRRVLPFSSVAEITAALHAAGFNNLRVNTELWITQYVDFNTLFTSIRGIGATQIGGNQRRGMMGKIAWQAAQARYEKLRDADGLLPVSYALLLVLAEKAEMQG